jgi:hypothetical protein
MVAMVDPNHVGKAIRSQLVLGGGFITIGDSYFDVGLLQLANVSTNLYRVDDFASDAVVLRLCSVDTVRKLISDTYEDRASVIATAMSLLFLRLFVVTCSSSDIPKPQAIAIIWSCMLYFTSIDISMTTKRNIVASAIPVICLLGQKKVTKIRLLTSEPAEHFFGCTRQKKREFTVSDFVSYVESLEIALKEMVDFNFRSGKGRSGYLCTINSFLSQITQELRANNANVSNQSDESGFGGVDVDYNHPFQSVSEQIETDVLKDINTATQFMVAFLHEGLNVTKEAISPFAKTFASFMDLAHVYFYFLSADTRAQLVDHVFSPPASNFMEQGQVDEYDDIAIEDVHEALRYAVNLALDDDNNMADVNVQPQQFIPNGLLQDSTENDDESISWKELTQVMKQAILAKQPQRSTCCILSLISSCMEKGSQRLNASTSDAQKFKSLKGRWWGESKAITHSECDEATLLKRGLMFRHESRTYKILNVFTKSYNKWRLETRGPANKTTRIQAVLIVEHRMIPNTYEVADISERRCISLSGDKVVPFAEIASHGWIAAGQM